MRSHRLARGVVRAVTTACATAPAPAPVAASASSSRGFYFVSASYQGRSLLSAATELALTVREAMGPDRPPHLITLFATPHAEWGAGLADTPQYVRELLTYEGAQPPVVMGGVLRSVAGGGVSLSREGGPCVALLAAHLPGVQLMPFHTSQSSLPALPGGGWADVVRATRAIAGAKEAAAAAAAAGGRGQTGGGASVQPNVCSGGSGGSAASTERTLAGRHGPVEVAAEWEAPAGPSHAGGGSGCPAVRPLATPTATAMESVGPEGQSHPPPHLQHPHPDHQIGPPQQRQMQAAGCGPTGGSGGGPVAPAAAAAAVESLGRHPPDVKPSPPSSSSCLPSSSSSSSSSSLSSSSLGAAEAAPCSVATLLLSTPHFVQVEELLRRFGQVAPGMQVVGGVTCPGAWGDSESNWGAVWLNDRTFAQGAVGCVLQGPFRLDTLVSPGFRGAGPVMRVTQAHGQYVLELDGEPVQRPLQRAISEALNSGELATSLKIGLGDPATATPGTTTDGGSHPQHRPRQRQQSVFPSQPTNQSSHPHPHPHPAKGQAHGGPPSSPAHHPQQQPLQRQQQQQAAAASASGCQFLTRNWFFQQGPPRPFMTVQSSAPIANGTPLQVHLQNYPAAHRHMRDRLREYAEQLPRELAAAEGAVGALALSCSALPFSEGPDVERCLPAAAFAGGKVEGEICTTVEGQPSRLHSFASCLAFLRPAGPLTAAER